jgi:hypothetical protein
MRHPWWFVAWWGILGGSGGYAVLIALYGCAIEHWRAYILFPPATWEREAPRQKRW